MKYFDVNSQLISTLKSDSRSLAIQKKREEKSLGFRREIKYPRLYLRSDFAICPLYDHFYKINDDMNNKIDDIAYS